MSNSTIAKHSKAAFDESKSIRILSGLLELSLIHISEPTRPYRTSRMPSSA